jgi:hypothetical protein
VAFTPAKAVSLILKPGFCRNDSEEQEGILSASVSARGGREIFMLYKYLLFMFSVCCVVAGSGCHHDLSCDCENGKVFQRRLIASPARESFTWLSEPPKDCPFEKSRELTGIHFTGVHSKYHCGDTWYPSWAANGNLYSPWTDGGTEGMISESSKGKEATTGQAVLKGEDPLDLEIINTAPPQVASALPYQGRYPCGSLVHEGVWYYGTYCLGPQAQVEHEGISYNWPVLGPMPGFRISTDHGNSWTPSPHTPEDPLFPEPESYLGPVKMGAPHFVDFGKNMKYSPDGKAYLLGMGAEANDPEPRFANLSWISADQVYLARVTPSIETINDLSAYEFFAGHNEQGRPVWTNNFEQMQPLLEWNNNMGCVTATYNARLGKYLMCVTDGWPTVAKMNSYILESDQLTGPWRLVSYMKDFGEQAYFLNFPSKFIQNDGRRLWLCYSANFSPSWQEEMLEFDPPGGRYGLCLHEVVLLGPDQKAPPEQENPLWSKKNVARKAAVSASSTHPGYSAEGVIDGIADGFPGAIREWASEGESEGAWIRLDWPEPVEVERIWLFDRPNAYDQVLKSRIELSDGSVFNLEDPLPDLAMQGVELSFSARRISWIRFEVEKAREGSQNIGLSEIGVFVK